MSHFAGRLLETVEAMRDAERAGCRFVAAYLSGMAAGFAEHLIAAGLE